MPVEADRADRQPIGHQRHIDHRIIALAQRIRSGQAEIGKGRGIELVEIRAFGQDAHRARQRTRSEQRALRPAQELHPLDVEQVGIDHGGIADGGDGQLVDIDGDRALQIGVIAVGGDAACREIVEILGRAVEHHARRLTTDAFIAGDALLGQLRLRKGGHAQRHILDALGAACGGDDDVLAGSGRTLVILRRGRGIPLLRHGGYRNCEQRRRTGGRKQPCFHQRSPTPSGRRSCVGVQVDHATPKRACQHSLSRA